MKHTWTGTKVSNDSTNQGLAVHNRQQPPLHPILELQRTVGNQAVCRLLQAKLQVSQPGDIYEKEADETARQVMAMPASDAKRPAQFQGGESIGRPGPVQKSTQFKAQREANTESNIDVDEGIEREITQSMGTGTPLPSHVRNFMDPRFGVDFSGVKVHSDVLANQMSEALNAQAFTVGADIYYGAGKSPSDLELTAHELTHVVQQGGQACHRVPPSLTDILGVPAILTMFLRRLCLSRITRVLCQLRGYRG